MGLARAPHGFDTFDTFESSGSRSDRTRPAPGQLEMNAMVTWRQVHPLRAVAGGNDVHQHGPGHGEVHKAPAIGTAHLGADRQRSADDGPGGGIEHHHVQIHQWSR